MPNHKAWIYSVNLTIIVIEIFLCFTVARAFNHPFWELIPISGYNLNVIIYSILVAVQLFTCICGLTGVYWSKLLFLKIYWMFMIPLVLLDLLMALSFVEAGSSLNANFETSLEYVVQQQISSGATACPLWSDVQSQLSCCPPQNIVDHCTQTDDLNVTSLLNGPCSFSQNCHFPILRWLYSRLDRVALLIYYMLVPLKTIVVVVLREDIQHIFSRSVFSHTSREWDTDDEEEYEAAKHFAPFVRREVLEEIISEPQKLYGA